MRRTRFSARIALDERKNETTSLRTSQTTATIDRASCSMCSSCQSQTEAADVGHESRRGANYCGAQETRSATLPGRCRHGNEFAIPVNRASIASRGSQNVSETRGSETSSRTLRERASVWNSNRRAAASTLRSARTRARGPSDVFVARSGRAHGGQRPSKPAD